MNLRFLFYFSRLVKENVWYVLVLSGLIVAIIIVQFIFFSQYTAYQTQYDTLTKDVQDLKSNTDYLALRKKILQEGYDLDKINPILSQLLPEQEDYFSIVAALEQISQKSQFVITSYVLRLSTSTRERLSFQIKGSGNQSQFLEFLKNYNFGGGRLITVDKINFSKQGGFNDTSIDLNFYNGNGATNNKTSTHITFTQDDKDFVKKIMNKVTIEFKQPEANLQYDTKVNPF